jgi:dGTPase
MEWDQLLCTQRPGQHSDNEPDEWKKYSITEFEKDYKTIVSSSAFRRLQDKTQVFPLDKSDFVRTRLTHSIETATLAKQLGAMIYMGYLTFGKEDKPGCPTITEGNRRDLCDTLMCAGLLHDLGNPPFGHFGESIIGDWFKKSFISHSLLFRGRPANEFLSNQMQNDLQRFDGNAQSLRILLKCAHAESTSDLKLTYAVIQALVKYPTSSLDSNKESENVCEHKHGWFWSDEEQFKAIATTTNTYASGSIRRHPLAYIIEAADDIAYATADLEDAFKKGAFTLDDFVSFYNNELEKIADSYYSGYAKDLIEPLAAAIIKENRTGESDSKAFNIWVKSARGWLMYVAAYCFVHNYKEIMAGQWGQDLFSGTFHQYSITILKKAMGKYVYDADSILRLEVSAHTVLSFLLDNFIPAAIHFDEDRNSDFCLSEPEKKYMSLISENYVADHVNNKTGDEGENLYLKLLMVTDYISGMTDSYARDLYRELNGII